MPSVLRSILVCIMLAAVSLPGAAQQRGSGMSAANMDQSKSTAPYHPGLGDLMTAFVQPRHIKLGLAGKAGNWPYAAYELGELKETFDDVGKLVPKHGKLEIPPAVAATVAQPMAALEKAIAAKDEATFTKEFAALTDACNACHQSADHPMIVIQMPTASPFPDQDFRPGQK